MNYLKFIIRILWEFPQFILGLLCLLYYRIINNISHIKYDKVNKVFDVRRCELSNCFSLGIFVFMIDTRLPIGTYEHEVGHSKQSTILGPLYLFIIGIPSATWCYYCDKYNKHGKIYYTFYTEKWADKLGNIKRI